MFVIYRLRNFVYNIKKSNDNCKYDATGYTYCYLGSCHRLTAWCYWKGQIVDDNRLNIGKLLKKISNVILNS